MRPSKEKYYLGVALEISKRGTCLRKNYGAVIVSNDLVVSTGYTGSPRGQTNCVDTNICNRTKIADLPKQKYDYCLSVHAEMNAMINATPLEMVGGVLYLAGIDARTGEEINPEPCRICAGMIINARFKYVCLRKQGQIHMMEIKYLL